MTSSTRDIVGGGPVFGGEGVSVCSWRSTGDQVHAPWPLWLKAVSAQTPRDW